MAKPRPGGAGGSLLRGRAEQRAQPDAARRKNPLAAYVHRFESGGAELRQIGRVSGAQTAIVIVWTIVKSKSTRCQKFSLSRRSAAYPPRLAAAGARVLADSIEARKLFGLLRFSS